MRVESSSQVQGCKDRTQEASMQLLKIGDLQSGGSLQCLRLFSPLLHKDTEDHLFFFLFWLKKCLAGSCANSMSQMMVASVT
jgi:hypothetical protein